jgi:hypothetical protein
MSTTLAASRPAPAQGSLLGEAEDVPPGGEAAGSSGGDPRRRPDDRSRSGDTVCSHQPGPKPKTLDDLVASAWEGLRQGTSECPVCGGRLEPEFGAHARPVAGRCADCGSVLH